MPILVSGAVALDHIMVFPDYFKNHILPEKLHTLNVSFNITSLKTHFGGTAGNIAFYLKMLGEDPLILATAGSDFRPYADWLDRHGISRGGIRIFDDVRTGREPTRRGLKMSVKRLPLRSLPRTESRR